MPLLFYGDARAVGLPRGRLLYADGFREVHTGIFDSYKVEGLAPNSRMHAICNIWHWGDKKHTILSWHEDPLKHEQTILLPGFLDQRIALELGRSTFKEVIPSAIVFRFRQDYDEVLVYD